MQKVPPPPRPIKVFLSSVDAKSTIQSTCDPLKNTANLLGTLHKCPGLQSRSPVGDHQFSLPAWSPWSTAAIYLKAKCKTLRKNIPKLCKGMPVLVVISKEYQSQVRATQMSMGEWEQVSWVPCRFRKLSSSCFGGGSEPTSRVRHPTHQSIWESPNHTYLQRPPLSTWRRACQNISTVPHNELVIWLAFHSGYPREDKGRVWTHLALSNRFLRAFHHAISLSLGLGV